MLELYDPLKKRIYEGVITIFLIRKILKVVLYFFPKSTARAVLGLSVNSGDNVGGSGGAW